MKRLFLLIATLQAFLFISVPAQAQTQFYVSIAWVAPTTAGKGTLPLTGANVLTGYKVYVSTSPSTVPSSPTFSATASQTSAAGNVPALPGQTLYVYVTACNSTGCSALSTAAVKVVPGVAASSATIPDPPTGVTIAALVPATS